MQADARLLSTNTFASVRAQAWAKLAARQLRNQDTNPDLRWYCSLCDNPSDDGSGRCCGQELMVLCCDENCKIVCSTITHFPSVHAHCANRGRRIRDMGPPTPLKLQPPPLPQKPQSVVIPSQHSAPHLTYHSPPQFQPTPTPHAPPIHTDPTPYLRGQMSPVPNPFLWTPEIRPMTVSNGNNGSTPSAPPMNRPPYSPTPVNNSEPPSNSSSQMQADSGGKKRKRTEDVTNNSPKREKRTKLSRKEIIRKELNAMPFNELVTGFWEDTKAIRRQEENIKRLRGDRTALEPLSIADLRAIEASHHRVIELIQTIKVSKQVERNLAEQAKLQQNGAQQTNSQQAGECTIS